MATKTTKMRIRHKLPQETSYSRFSIGLEFENFFKRACGVVRTNHRKIHPFFPKNRFRNRPHLIACRCSYSIYNLFRRQKVTRHDLLPAVKAPQFVRGFKPKDEASDKMIFGP